MICNVIFWIIDLLSVLLIKIMLLTREWFVRSRFHVYSRIFESFLTSKLDISRYVTISSKKYEYTLWVEGVFISRIWSNLKSSNKRIFDRSILSRIFRFFSFPIRIIHVSFFFFYFWFASKASEISSSFFCRSSYFYFRHRSWYTWIHIHKLYLIHLMYFPNSFRILFFT